MTATPFLKLSLMTSFLAIGGAFGILQYAQLERGQEITRLKKENAHMRLVISQRESAGPLTADSVVHRSTGEISSTSNEGSSTPNDQQTLTDAARRWPTRIYLNAGQATPIAALQTMAWACDQGNVKAMARLFIIDDEARPKAAAIYASIPAERKAEWSSLEAFAAAMIVGDGIEQPYPGREVLALAKIEPITVGRVRLMLLGAVVSGLEFQHTAEGWKYVISVAVVDDYIARN